MAKQTKRKLEEEEGHDEEVSTSGDELCEQDGSDDETSNSEASSSAEDDGDSEDSEDEAGDTVEVDLEFFDPSEKDFHGLKALLRTYLDDTDFSGCSELVETIIKQSTVGTVVKTAENDDPIGVLTALNIRRHAALGCMHEIRDFLRRRCKDSGLAAKLQEAWEAEGTALVVSERLLNCPPQLAPPLHQALFEEEIPWATEDEPSQEARDSFGFASFLMASRVYADYSPTQQPSAAAERQASVPKAKRKKAEKGKMLVVYARPEDEFYHKHAAWSYTFPASGKVVQKDELQPLRLVMLLLPEQAAAAREELNAVVGNVARGMKPAPA